MASEQITSRANCRSHHAVHASHDIAVQHYPGTNGRGATAMLVVGQSRSPTVVDKHPVHIGQLVQATAD